MDTILALDQAVFFWVNGDLHNSFLDGIMPYWREKTTWIPLYMLLVATIFWKFKLKQGLMIVLALAATVGVADTLSSKVIKPSVERLRPCNDPAIKESVDLLVHCGGGYSFTSSHATNHFAVAVFVCLTLGGLLRWIRLPLLLWAGSIAFGQVYVGVHYPIDILCGSLLGCFVGFGMAKGGLFVLNYLEERSFAA